MEILTVVIVSLCKRVKILKKKITLLLKVIIVTNK